MKKNKSLFVLLALCFSAIWADAQVSLSFEESLRLLRQENQSLKIADKSIEIAKAERDKLNAFWYPSLQSSGAFVHMSEKIEVKQPLSVNHLWVTTAERCRKGWKTVSIDRYVSVTYVW